MTAATLPPSATPPRMPMNRTLVISVSVVVFHVLLLWALQNGLLRRAAQAVVPAEILTHIIEIESPKVAPPPPPPPPQPAPKTPKTPPPPPQPAAIRDPLPAPRAPVGMVEPQPPAPPLLAPVAPAPQPPAPPAAPAAPKVVEVTQGETEYIKPPKPVYPPLSRRSNETGVVVIEVYYSAAGFPLRASVLKSSGFDRLDRAARDAVMASQVTPFRRAGAGENTEFLLKAPINFVLE